MATPEEKQTLLEKLIARGVVMIHLDARQPGVKVADGLEKEVDLKLNLNHQKGKGDLRISTWGVKETLRFSGRWVPVSVPWCAVYGMTAEGEESVVFAEDVPEELIERMMVKLQHEGHSLEDLEERRPRSIWADKSPAPPAPAAAPPSAASPRVAPPADEARGEPGAAPPKRGHLRLVK